MGKPKRKKVENDSEQWVPDDEVMNPVKEMGSPEMSPPEMGSPEEDSMPYPSYTSSRKKTGLGLKDFFVIVFSIIVGAVFSFMYLSKSANRNLPVPAGVFSQAVDSKAVENELREIVSTGEFMGMLIETGQLEKLRGMDGEKGAPGEQGEPGPSGPIGLEGITGPPGPEGPQGMDGLSGRTGPQGLEGPPGPPGLMGLTGLQGEQGPQGSIGLEGLPGPQGPPGPAGAGNQKALNGVSGWELLQSKNVKVEPGKRKTVFMSCSPGKILLGGGYNAEKCTDCSGVNSYPSSSNSWQTTLVNKMSSQSANLRVYVICAEPTL